MGSFFRTFGGGEGRSTLVVGEMVAEGGQAELYLAPIKWANPALNEQVLELGYEFVLKVFRKGLS